MSFHNCFRTDFPELVPDTKIIRLSIFLIAGVCVGFPTLLWVLNFLYRQCKKGCKISAFTIFLLLSDLLELLLNPVLLAFMIKGHFTPCLILRLLFGARLCGYQFHQLLVVESILTLKYPSFAVNLSPNIPTILCVFVWILTLLCNVIPNCIIYEINVCLCVLPVILGATTYLVTCKASSYTNQAMDRKPDMLVLCVALFTVIILHVPYLLTFFTDFPIIVDYLVTMRLISEPLLCALICREKRIVKTAHAQTDHTQ
ncbi:hypothetical protein AMELA_G00273550 [Ameiurus melas]|uniref:G-protein coupled receptors family 1 profile domain-containing protein n=1 Tax=Ameiurus melas TaxID=219545 RepID=A0A7J5ZL98_AMEME|nr:hypothetical protein AMELA_G00273550 [Ameiurus melas]